MWYRLACLQRIRLHGQIDAHGQMDAPAEDELTDQVDRPQGVALDRVSDHSHSCQLSLRLLHLFLDASSDVPPEDLNTQSGSS